MKKENIFHGKNNNKSRRKKGKSVDFGKKFFTLVFVVLTFFIFLSTKKMRKRGFTLVEILIVIVIIGILIGALVPRMQSAQGRARDVARKNDLSQIQSAIVTSYSDKGYYPCVKDGCSGGVEESGGTKASSGLNVSDMKNILTAAGMNGIPSDPLKANKFVGVGSGEGSDGEYRYVTTMSNGVENGGFVLMAKTEVDGGSNRVVCSSGAGATSDVGIITGGTDSAKLKTCVPEFSSNTSSGCSNDLEGTCTYTNVSQLRYILIY